MTSAAEVVECEAFQVSTHADNDDNLLMWGTGGWEGWGTENDPVVWLW